MIIRKATMTDLEGITAIYNELHDQEEQGTASIGWNRKIYPTRDTAETSIKSGDMFVMILHDEVVASAKINQEQVAEYVNATWEYDVKEEEVMVLHTLVVSPRVKGKGLGKKFVAFYENYALENNCHYLRMDTNEKNKAARNLYYTLGYKEVGVVPSIFNGIEGVRLVCLEKKI